MEETGFGTEEVLLERPDGVLMILFVVVWLPEVGEIDVLLDAILEVVPVVPLVATGLLDGEGVDV